jgi:hypothetical protein
MAEGSDEKTRHEKLFLATAVDMGFLADEGVISVTQMCTDDRMAYRNRLKNRKSFSRQLTGYVCLFISVLFNAFTYLHYPSLTSAIFQVINPQAIRVKARDVGNLVLLPPSLLYQHVHCKVSCSCLREQ